MTTPFLLLAYGVSAIRRHPGVDDKVELFSDAVRRVRKSKGSMAVSSRFEKLLQEWEGSSWSSGANFTSVVEQIESDLIDSINAQHLAEQGTVTSRMTELVCKDILVKNAHEASTSADEAANGDVILEKAGAEKLRKSLTKLKNLDLIRQRSWNVQDEPTYQYPNTLGDWNVDGFSCAFDCAESSSECDNCDTKYDSYSEASTAELKLVRDHLDMEQITWVGFDNEERALSTEQEEAETDAKSSYDSWVVLNDQTRIAWVLRESHICKKEGSKESGQAGHYGLNEYDDGKKQTCVHDAAIPISFQAQHSDFCELEHFMKLRETRLTTANQSGSQNDQQYEVEVLNTILCILNKLKVAETNLTNTDVGAMVDTCKLDQTIVIPNYIFKSDIVNCASKFAKPNEDWCFSNFGPTPSVEQPATLFGALKVGNDLNPPCDVVQSGADATERKVKFFGAMSFRWRTTIYTDGGERHPLTTPEAWESNIAVYSNEDTLAKESFGGKGFLTENTQGYYYVWARKPESGAAADVSCAWTDVDLSQSTGFESRLSTDTFKLCAVPVVGEYITVEKGSPNWESTDVTYQVSGNAYHHRGEEIMRQCDSEVPSGSGPSYHW